MSRLLLIAVLAMALVGTLTPCVVEAKSYFLDPTDGDDSHDGTRDKPLKSLPYDDLEDYDEIVILPKKGGGSHQFFVNLATGVIPVHLTIRGDVSISKSNRVTLTHSVETIFRLRVEKDLLVKDLAIVDCADGQLISFFVNANLVLEDVIISNCESESSALPVTIGSFSDGHVTLNNVVMEKLYRKQTSYEEKAILLTAAPGTIIMNNVEIRDVKFIASGENSREHNLVHIRVDKYARLIAKDVVIDGVGATLKNVGRGQVVTFEIEPHSNVELENIVVRNVNTHVTNTNTEGVPMHFQSVLFKGSNMDHHIRNVKFEDISLTGVGQSHVTGVMFQLGDAEISDVSFKNIIVTGESKLTEHMGGAVALHIEKSLEQGYAKVPTFKSWELSNVKVHWNGVGESEDLIRPIVHGMRVINDDAESFVFEDFKVNDMSVKAADGNATGLVLQALGNNTPLRFKNVEFTNVDVTSTGWALGMYLNVSRTPWPYPDREGGSVSLESVTFKNVKLKAQNTMAIEMMRRDLRSHIGLYNVDMENIEYTTLDHGQPHLSAAIYVNGSHSGVIEIENLKMSPTPVPGILTPWICGRMVMDGVEFKNRASGLVPVEVGTFKVGGSGDSEYCTSGSSPDCTLAVEFSCGVTHCDLCEIGDPGFSVPPEAIDPIGSPPTTEQPPTEHAPIGEVPAAEAPNVDEDTIIPASSASHVEMVLGHYWMVLLGLTGVFAVLT